MNLLMQSGVNKMEMLECKIAVLGGGPAGYTAAIRAAQLGVSVVLVDEGGLGGICLREGCIPSKAMLSATKAIVRTKELIASGIAYGDVKVDLDRLVAHKDQVVTNLMSGLHELVKANRVNLLRGHGTISGRGRLVVNTEKGPVHVKCEHVIVCTGSIPIEIPELPVDGVRVISSSNALSLKEVPSSLCVVGGGYIGLELATLFARLGSRVTVVELKDQILPGTDRDLANVVSSSLKRLGVEVLTDTTVAGAETVADGVIVHVMRKDQMRSLVCDRVLVAVGRRPNVEGIGLETTEVEIGSGGWLIVDDRMQTRCTWVFAAGDVVGPPMLAHKAHAEGEVAAEAAVGHTTCLRARVVPAVAFTEPEVATVGLNEAQARQRGIKYIKGRFPLTALGRAVAEGAASGFIKVLAQPETHVLLGCGIVGAGAGEVIAEATLAIEKAVTLEDASIVIHSHPTFAEAFQEACRSALGRAIHVVNR